MNRQAMMNWLSWAASILAVSGLLYFLTAPPIILAHYRRTGDGGIPSFYCPLMDLAFSDFGAPMIWYFNNVWHADLSAIEDMPEFGWFAAAVDILIGMSVVGIIVAPFTRLAGRNQLGQLSAAGGATDFSAPLDADDAAGKADQDWGQGSVPCPAGGFPNGGGGGAAGVVPNHSTGARSLATARRGYWMNEKRMKTSVNRGEVSLSPTHAAGWGVKVRVGHGCDSEKPGIGVEKGLEPLTDEKIIRKATGKAQFES